MAMARAKSSRIAPAPVIRHKTVMLMVAFGAQLFPEDAATITKYLSTYLSNQPAPPPK
jgi:hypothetical protein